MITRRHDRTAMDRTALESLLAADVCAMTTEAAWITRIFGSEHKLGSHDLLALLHIMVAETAGTPLTQAELRNRIGLSAPAITYLVDRMIDARHIRREADPADRRKAILRYETRGMQVARDFFGALGLRTRAAMTDLPDCDLAAAHRVFVAFRAAIKTFRDGIGARATRAEQMNDQIPTDERNTMADKDFSKGDKVTWKSHGKNVKGTVEEKITDDTEAAGRTVRASKGKPQYRVKSSKTGADAVHKPDALGPDTK